MMFTGEREVLGEKKNLSRCHFVHHKCQTYRIWVQLRICLCACIIINICMQLLLVMMVFPYFIGN